AATPDHVLDLRGVEPGHLGEHRGDDECREVVGATLDERALVRASDRRAGSGDDDGFGHDPLRIASDGWSTLVLGRHFARMAIAENRRAELHELAKIYEERGVEPGLARLVADQLMAHDAVGAHARDELGISDVMVARPMQAALTSAASFTVAALVPVLAVTLAAKSVRIGLTAVLTIAALVGLGALGAQLGGAPRGRAAIRVVTLS